VFVSSFSDFSKLQNRDLRKYPPKNGNSSTRNFRGVAGTY